MAGSTGFGYKPALDGMRAFAVLAVFAYHLGFSWSGGGFLGVDAFFVLSGYLITSLLLVEHASSGRIDLKAFWVRRARRLLPAVVLLLAVVAVVGAAWVAPAGRPQLRTDGIAALFYVYNWHAVLSGQSYFDLFSAPSPLEHMWSLAIEEQFYVVWPLVVLGLLALARGRRRLLVTAIGAGIAASALAMRALHEAGDPSRAYFGTDTRAHSLLVGALLALVMERRSPGARANAALQALAVPAAAVAVAAWVVVGDRDSWMYRSGGFLLYAVVVAVLVAAVVQPGSLLGRGLSVAPLRFVGRLSYGLYLWHWPVVVFLTTGRTGLSGLPLQSLQVALAFLLAFLSYELVERPVRERRRLVTASTALPALAGSAMVVTAAFTITGAQGVAPSSIFAVPGAGNTPVLVAPRVPVTTASAPPSTTAAPDTVAPDTAVTTTVPPAAGPRLLTAADLRPGVIGLVGDSVAASLLPGLQALGEERGLAIAGAAIPGCGAAGAFATTPEGTPFPWSEACVTSVPELQQGLIDTYRPSLVLWLSSWESADLLVDGRHVRFGTDEGDRSVLEQIEVARQRLTSQGALLVLLTAPPRTVSNLTGPPAEEQIRQSLHLNGLLERFAAAHPDTVRVLPFADLICPGGPPCPRQLDGVTLRPDGAHFDETTTRVAAAKLLPYLTGTA